MSKDEDLSAKGVTLLGMNLDPKVNWNQHVANICTKLSRVTYLLRKLRNEITAEYLTLINYHGLFHSRLSYGLELWGHATGAADILLLQKKALRTMTFSPPQEHCKPIFKRLCILTIYSQYILLSLLYVRQNTLNLPTRADTHGHNTRNKHFIELPYCRLSTTKDRFPNLAVRMFNMLPDGVKELDMPKFKTKIKKWLLERPFYSIKEFIEEDKTLTNFI